MDFADGTLLYLAKREFLSVILTVDHADFAAHRIEALACASANSVKRRISSSLK
jgi:predicted nucleic acid-binding protein